MDMMRITGESEMLMGGICGIYGVQYQLVLEGGNYLRMA